MIKVEELRIGNIIGVAESFYSGKSVIINTVTVSHLEDDNEINHNYGFYPIPLTEEWLLKFGFEEENLHSLSFGRMGITAAKAQDDDILILLRSDIGLDYYPIKIVEYVHELQNLVFALTNKELKLKNK